MTEPDRTLAGTLRRLVGGFLGYGTGAAARRLLGLALVPVFTRNLTTEQYGIVATAAVAVELLSPVLGLGLRGAVTRQYFDVRDDARALARYLFSVLAGNAVLSCLLTAVAVGILAANASAVWVGIPVSPHGFVIVLTAFFVTLIKTVLSVHRAREGVAWYVGIDVGHYAVAGALAVLAVIIAGWGALGKLLGDMLGAALALMVAGAGLNVLRRRSPPGAFSADALKRALVFGLPLVPHLLASWVSSGIDRFFVAGQMSVAMAGIYDIGYKSGAVVMFPVVAINLAWGPIVYDVASERDDAARILGSLYTLMLGGLCLVTLATGLFGDFLVSILGGTAYEMAVAVVTPIAVSHLFYGVYVLANQAFFYANATRLLPALTIGTATGNVILNLILIPPFGLEGAAYATLISYSLLGIVAHVWARRFIRFEIDMTLVGVAAGGLVLLLGGYHLFASGLRAAVGDAGVVGVKFLLLLLYSGAMLAAVRLSFGERIPLLVRRILGAARGGTEDGKRDRSL